VVHLSAIVLLLPDPVEMVALDIEARIVAAKDDAEDALVSTLRDRFGRQVVHAPR
jgi:hypothetical protein